MANERALEMVARLRDEATPIIRNLNREIEKFGRGSGLRDVRDRFKEVDHSVTEAAKKLREVFAPAMEGFGIATVGKAGLAAAAVYAVVKSLNELGKEGQVLGRLSVETRTSAVELKKMAELGEKNQISAEETYASYANMARTIGDLTGGPHKEMVGQGKAMMEYLQASGPAARVAAAEILSFVKANPGKTAESFLVIMEQIGHLPAWDQIRVARELKLPPVADWFKQWKDFKSPFTTEDFERMKEYGEKVDELGLKWKRVWEKSVIEMAPAVIAALDGIDHATSNWLKDMGEASRAFWSDFEKAKPYFDKLIEWERKNVSDRLGPDKERRLEIGKRLDETLKALEDKYADPVEGPAPKLPDVPAPAVVPPPEGSEEKHGALPPAPDAPRSAQAGYQWPQYYKSPDAPPTTEGPTPARSFYERTVDKLKSAHEAIDPFRAMQPDMSTDKGFWASYFGDVAKYAPWAIRAGGNIRLTPTGSGSPRLRIDNRFTSHDAPRLKGPMEMPAPLAPKGAMQPAPPLGKEESSLPPFSLNETEAPPNERFESALAADKESSRRSFLDWSRLDRALKNQTGFQVEGNASITVDVNAPKGTRVDASANGMFRKMQINRAQQMGFSEYAGEAYPEPDR